MYVVNTVVVIYICHIYIQYFAKSPRALSLLLLYTDGPALMGSRALQVKVDVSCTILIALIAMHCAGSEPTRK